MNTAGGVGVATAAVADNDGPADAASVCLVAMPWQALDSPSLPIGLLQTACVQAGLAKPMAYHANLAWAEHLLEASDGELEPSHYVEVAENGIFHGLGDWVFAAVLSGVSDFGLDALRQYAAERDIDLTALFRMRSLASEFITSVVDDILALDPAVVGFSTTFMQNVPSLAAAQLLKQRAPRVTIIFGGGNCDGPMGVGLHNAFGFVDFVVRGEGEIALPRLLAALQCGDDLSEVPGLCWRDADGDQHVNPSGSLLGGDALPHPDFDDWFEALSRSPIRAHIEPKLIMETSRGCWWGQAHHCTFCGLNGTAMEFRSKSASRAVDELCELVGKYRSLDVIFVDNIIDHTYFDTVLPQLAQLDWDLRLHYELKSNLRDGEAEALRRAHVTHVQPGIESLCSPVLALMDKGVTGARNVATLRDLESCDITVSWNWLYGFPGETAEHYTDVLAQLDSLIHLQPPASVARILLERFSPYFNTPALGFTERRPARPYEFLYDIDPDQIEPMAYLFDAPPCGLTDEQAQVLLDVTARWRSSYPHSSLTHCQLDPHTLQIIDRRAGRQDCILVDDPVLVGVYTSLSQPRSMSAVLRRTGTADERQGARIRNWLHEQRERGLVFVESGQFVSLSTDSAPRKML